MEFQTDSSKEERDPLDAKFDDLVNHALKEWKTPGLSVAVVNGDSTFTKGYGIASYPDTPVTPETLFFAGSTTKAFTAAAVSLLVDDDKEYKDIQWTTPISHIIRDDFVLSDSYWTEHITLEDALCHRTGMPRHEKCYGGKDVTAQKITRQLRHLPLTKEPRTVSQYCNLMFVAVSHAVEVRTGEKLANFLSRRIWQPLGMSDTYFVLSDAEKSGKPFSKGYYWDKEKNENVPVPYMDMPEISGAGCNISNVVDYSKWLRTMINMEGPMSKAGHQQLVKPRITFDIGLPPSMPSIFAGLGWFMLWYQGQKILWHTGGLKGFTAIVYYIPARSWACVMMSNSTLGSFMHESLAWHLIDEFLAVPLSERFDWQKKARDDMKEYKDKFNNAPEQLYPGAKSSIAHSLPLGSYTGTYSHPGYQEITIVEKDGKLHADVLERTWAYEMDLKHISGEHFLASMYGTHSYILFTEAVKAKFNISPRGKADRFELEFEDGMYWVEFHRVEDAQD